MKKYTLLFCVLMFVLTSQAQDYYNIAGALVQKTDYVDTAHPDGWFTITELEAMTAPTGFEFAEPSDYTRAGSPGNLDIELRGIYSMATNSVVFEGRKVWYAAKARNEFYPIQVTQTRISLKHWRTEYDLTGQKYRVRLVQAGTHAPKYNMYGAPRYPYDENMAVYMGKIPDPLAGQLLPLVHGINDGYIFPTTYDGYQVYEFYKQHTGLVLMHDEDNRLYFYLLWGLPAVNIQYIDASKNYTIIYSEQ
ncbi:MAG: hypothetical protein K9H64_14005 [Bacteroidales bacterium]|nr:hypothetical protein [Bacteroidales bacterium]MCF8456724.1 hypothetical protein [Bacteroidales bacterium]